MCGACASSACAQVTRPTSTSFLAASLLQVALLFGDIVIVTKMSIERLSIDTQRKPAPQNSQSPEARAAATDMSADCPLDSRALASLNQTRIHSDIERTSPDLVTLARLMRSRISRVTSVQSKSQPRRGAWCNSTSLATQAQVCRFIIVQRVRPVTLLLARAARVLIMTVCVGTTHTHSTRTRTHTL